MEEERTPPPQREDEKRKRRTTSGGSPSKGRQGEREGQEETEDLTVVSGYTAGSPYLTNPPAYENPISDPPAYVNPISDPPAHVNPISDPPAYVNPISDPPAYENPISLHSTGSSVSPLLGHASTSRDLSGHSPLKKRCKYTSPSGITTSKPGPSSSGYQGQSVLSVTLDDVRNRIRSGGDETSSIAENLLRECAIGTLTPPKNPPPNPFGSPRRKKARSGTPSKASRSPLAHSPKPDSTRSSDTAGAVSRAKKASSHKRPEFLNLPNPLSTEVSSEMPPTAEIDMSSIPMASAEPRHTTIQHPPTMFAEEQELSRVLPSTSELLEGNLSGEGDHNLSPSNQSESRMPNLSPRDQFSSKFTPSPERQPSENSELLGIADNMHRCYDCADYYSRSSCNKCLRRLYRSIHERPVSPSIPGPSRSELSPERRSNLRPLYISPQSNREMTSHFGSPGTPENYFKPDACGLLRSPNKCCACIGYSLQGETPWLNPIISSSSTEHQTDTSPNKSGSSLSDTFPTKSKSPDSDSISLKPCRICFQKYIEKLHPLPIGDFGDICNICKHCFKTCKRRVPKAEKRKASHLSPRKLDYIRSQ
ncbi:hypothetical protein Avbf_10684 [Armadillidium vulgare]|nr:hypothetical protein Avbf_10684 [Armadillidium vulgare]